MCSKYRHVFSLVSPAPKDVILVAKCCVLLGEP
ncbi:Uncharacterised protein [Vibrio cholerae]|nr:Uncharacterised protein [Vibrio cholerae]